MPSRNSCKRGDRFYAVTPARGDMASDVPELDVSIPAIDQVGLVVEDLEDGMDRFGGLLGIEPWSVYEFAPPALSETIYRGSSVEASWRLAIATVGEIDVELIEPVTGETSYTAHLDRHGEGLHHVACFSLDRPRAVADALQAAGIPVEQRGVFRGSTFWYFDMREAMHGVLFEIVAQEGEPAEPDETYPES